MSRDESGPGLPADAERALAKVLDEIIPPSDDGRLPGAGELGLAGTIAQRLPELRPLIVQGLAALAELAADLGARDFAALSRAERRDALNQLATRLPAFLPGLLFHTYVGYYQDGRVLEALGIEGRPPFPQGYELDPGDLGLLDDVRRRPKLYRES